MSKGCWPGRGNWTADRLLELEQLLARGLTDDAIAVRLGKTVNAVCLARKRHGIPCRRKLIMTQRGVSRLMGVSCQKTVSAWIRRGWLHSRRGARIGHHFERYITREQLLTFLECPAHWHVWKPERITEPNLRDWALDMRTVRYLRPGEIAQRFFVHHKTVNTWIGKGLLPAQRWGNWWVRESDLEGFELPCNRSKRGRQRRCFSQSERLRIWQMREQGETWQEVADALNRPLGSVAGAYGRMISP